MITKSKLALALVIAMGIASPAFAQSFDPAIGTGNTLPFSYQQTDPSVQVVARKLFDMVPSAASTTNSRAPADMGGGSLGYNQELAIH